MVFRITAAIGALLITSAGIAQDTTFTVTHVHLRDGAPGKLTVTEAGIEFVEAGKHQDHSRTWTYEKIRELELTSGTLTVRSYGRRVDTYRIPKEFAPSVYPAWREKLDQRFIAALADPRGSTLEEFPARLTGLFKGIEGSLVFGDDQITFRAARPAESRTWRFADIENIASASPFDFSIVTLERNHREFRFQLQHPMEEARFDELWRKIIGRVLL